MPEKKDWNKVDRAWLTTIVATHDPGNYKKMVTEAKKNQMKKLADGQGMMMDIKPEFKAILDASISISCKHPM